MVRAEMSTQTESRRPAHNTAIPLVRTVGNGFINMIANHCDSDHPVYECNICNQTFARRDILKTHMKAHKVSQTRVKNRKSSGKRGKQTGSPVLESATTFAKHLAAPPVNGEAHRVPMEIVWPSPTDPASAQGTSASGGEFGIPCLYSTSVLRSS
ncbi:hypothetical protein B0H11DRAFT_1994494 [Mycena galericulata]|nr:hypothetical protein B0H11DRAFT_1994494 [Mycena galericulata]